MGSKHQSSVLLLQILLLTLNELASATSNCNATLCKLRLELAAEVHALRNYRDCGDVYKRDCICNRTIDVQFNEHPPYIYKDKSSGNVVGLLPGILKQALSICCYKCTRIRYLTPYQTTTEGLIMFQSSTILMPFVTYSNARRAVGDIFIGAIPTKGVVYLTSEEVSLMHFSKFASSISSNWPLFCISLLLAIDAGIIVWLLDCSRNEAEFPNGFLQGMLEGLWWAYVSMTTVGYGDKTPKSLPARAFGILWITVGISLSGIFTASLITGMTQSLDEGTLNIEGKKVGILNATRYELTIGMREGADIKGYATYEELINEMKNGNLDGLLLDVLVVKHYWTELQRDITNLHYRIDAIKNSETSFGVLFSMSEYNRTNRDLGLFLENFFLENRDNIDVIVKMSEKDLTKKLAEGLENENHSASKSIFNSPEIYKLLFKYIGIATLVLVVIGFAYEKVRDWLQVYMTKRKDKKCIRIGSSTSSTIKKADMEVNSTVEYTRRMLRIKFQRIMSELDDNGNKDLKHMKDKVLLQVFHYQDANGCFDNEVQLHEMHENSEV